MSEREVKMAIAIQERRSPRGSDARIVTEMSICQSEARADLAVVGKQLVGWEIKTEADSLARLDRQVTFYSMVFDRVWLAVHPRHLPKAMGMIPDWWGVARLENSNGTWSLPVIRRSKINRSIDIHALVSLLWRYEVLGELELLGLAGGLRRAPKRQLWQQLAAAAPSSISRTKLQERVRGRLMTRTDWRVD